MTSIDIAFSSHDAVAPLEWLSEPPIWVGDGNLLDVQGYVWGAAVIEVTATPRGADGDGINLAEIYRRLASRVTRSLRPWQNRGSLEVRYVWTGANRLRMLLIARALGANIATAHAWAEAMLRTVVGLYIEGYEFGPLQEPIGTDVIDWAEIERAEEVRAPSQFVPPELASYYYLIHPLGGSGRSWPTLFRGLADLKDTGFISVTLMPTVMTDVERAAVDHICTIAQHLSTARQEYDFFGNPVTQPADAAAADVLHSWQRFPDRTGVLARIGIASSRRELQQVTAMVGATLTEGSDQSANRLSSQFKVVSGLSEFEIFQTSTLGVIFPRSRHPVWSLPDAEAPLSVERLPYFFSEEEAGGLLLLPVPDGQGVAGMPTARRASERRGLVTSTKASGPSVRLGRALHRGVVADPVDLPLVAVNRHTLVVGASGSGKTTTVMSLLVQLWRDHGIPFLVIESVKAEYRSLLGLSGMDQLKVITLGNETVAPLRLNPLEPPPGIRCEIFKGAVLAALKLAMPLFSPQPEILATAIGKVYRRAGWEDETTTSDGVTPPSLRDLRREFVAEAARIGYEGEARNIARGFDARVESLLTGSLGKLLDTVTSSNFEDLLLTPTVIEMNDVLDADNQAVLAAFLLDRVRFNAKRRGSSHGQLKHVTVIEEAHRLLAKTNVGTGNAESGNQARAESVRMFCEAIAELRFAGEGFILSSQSPSALADAAVANTGTRLVHRMESSADRRTMLEDFDADLQLREIAARLRRGEALVRWPERDEVEVISVLAAPGVDTSRQVDDLDVSRHMRAYRTKVQRLLPYKVCTLDVCSSGCDPGVRAAGRRAADDIEDEAADLWQAALQSGEPATLPIIELAAELCGPDTLRVYCTASHLNSRAIALISSTNSDARPGLIRAVAEVVNRGSQ